MTERIKIGPKKKISFVCSGGANKAGAFHLGVALALQEQGFKFCGGIATDRVQSTEPQPMEISTYVGSSAGSIIAAYLASGYSLDNIFNSYLGNKVSEEEMRTYTPKLLPRMTYQKMFNFRQFLTVDQIGQLRQFRSALFHLFEGNWDALIELKWLKMTGIFSTSGIEQYMRTEVLPSNSFKHFIPDLFIIATQLNHSRKVVFGSKIFNPPAEDQTCLYDTDTLVSDACAASTALPLIFSPYGIKKGNQTIHYIDGEIRDTLSSHVAADAGADLIIASYTHQPYHFHTDIGSLTQYGISAIVIQSIYLLIEQKIKNHIYNREANRRAIDAVSKYCKSVDISEKHRHHICTLLESKLNYRSNVDYIYINPRPNDSKLFLAEHFSFSPKKMKEIVRSGFRAAIDTLRKYDFSDRPRKPTVVTTSLSGI